MDHIFFWLDGDLLRVPSTWILNHFLPYAEIEMHQVLLRCLLAQCSRVPSLADHNPWVKVSTPTRMSKCPRNPAKLPRPGDSFRSPRDIFSKKRCLLSLRRLLHLLSFSLWFLLCLVLLSWRLSTASYHTLLGLFLLAEVNKFRCILFSEYVDCASKYALKHLFIASQQRVPWEYS